MQEDKAYDSLNDEMFPGLVFARITLYKTEPLLFKEDEVFKEYKDIQKNSEPYTLKLYVYLARNLPAGDKTGASDPFVLARCSGQIAKSRTKYETLNPSFFETLDMKVILPKGLLNEK